MGDYIKQFSLKQYFKFWGFSNKKEKYLFKGCPGVPENKVFFIKKEFDKEFVILNLTDNHFSDYDIRMPFAVEAAGVIKKLVSEVKPDLITVTGDIVCGKSSYSSIRYFTDMMESFQVFWAPVFGNHDDETNCDLNYLADIMMKSPHCLFAKGDPLMGVGNYIIDIAKPDGETVERLYMIDSQHSQPDYAQMEWFNSNAKDSAAKESSVFMHIPLPDYQLAFEDATDENGKWKNGYDVIGENHEKICCERDNKGNPVFRGFFEILSKTDGLKYVFCGHEHLNNWSLLWKGIRLTYTLKVGKGSGFRMQFNGGTVIKVGNRGIKSISHLTYRRRKFVNIAHKEFY